MYPSTIQKKKKRKKEKRKKIQIEQKYLKWKAKVISLSLLPTSGLLHKRNHVFLEIIPEEKII
jgi:hypothetical protein